jgi:hypothetical protein
LGLFLLRGDNIVLFGESDDNQSTDAGVNLKQISHAEMKERKGKGKKELTEDDKVDWDLE